MAISIADIGLSALRRFADLWRATRSSSLIDFTRAANVEPICLIDNSCLYQSGTGEIMQSLLSIFSGYYLLGSSMMTNIGSINVHRHLDRLNPNRNPEDSIVNTAGWMMATEAFRDGLPSYGGNLKHDGGIPSFEAECDVTDDGHIDIGMGSPRENAQALKELANLSVGKQFILEMTDGERRGNIPVNIRLKASTIPADALVHILASDSVDKTWKTRMRALKTGELEFINDILLCRDLVSDHQKGLRADKTGAYSNILKRKRHNRLAGFLSGNPSVATASNMVITTPQAIAELEMKINGSFDNFKARQRVFDSTALIIIAVYDAEWDRVTMYYHNQVDTSSYDIADLKKSNKGNGPDVTEILKAFQMQKAPVL